MPSDKHLAQLKTFNGTERQLAAEGVLDGAKEEKKKTRPNDITNSQGSS